MPLPFLQRLKSRLSAWNHRRRVSRHQRKHAYPDWVAAYDTLTPGDLEALRQRAGAPDSGPLISLLLPAPDPGADRLEAAVAMLKQQIYPRWELCVGLHAPVADELRSRLESLRASTPGLRCVMLEDGEAREAHAPLLNAVRGDFCAYLEEGVLLRPHALQVLAATTQRHPGAGLVYCDDDELDARGQRCRPRFKPDWNLTLFRSCELLSGLCLYRTDVLRRSGGWRSGYGAAAGHELALRCSEGLDGAAILHIPCILCHRQDRPAGNAAAAAVPHALRAVQDHLDRMGIDARAKPDGAGWRVAYALPGPAPSVDLIVPTRDRLDLLRLCVSSVLEKTDYPDFRLIVVDNGSVETATLEYLEELQNHARVRIIRDPAPFNYSRLNNLAVAQSKAEFVCLLNNDIEAIHSSWLQEMVSQASRDRVGIVGARLWYPDDTLQHGGMIVGIGSFAGHAHKHFPRSDPGYLGRSRLAQEFSSVTGACLLIRRRLYLEVGGLNEQDLAVACNDVDLCLKVGAAGWRVVWTPHAELYHHESASRGDDDDAIKAARFSREIAYMRHQWSEVMRHDPAYNPNLTAKYEDFTLAFPPRSGWKPWLQAMATPASLPGRA